MLNNDDPILAGYQHAGLHDDGMLELVREGFRQAPGKRAAYMEDYRVVGDRIVYDGGDTEPYTVMPLSALNAPLVQVADAGTTMTDGSPAEPTFGEKLGEVESYVNTLFSAPIRAFVSALAGIVDFVDIEDKTGAKEFVEMLRKTTEQSLEGAGTATQVTSMGGELAGGIVGPGIGVYNILKNFVSMGKYTSKLPKSLQTTLAVVLTDIGVLGIADDPNNPLTKPFSGQLLEGSTRDSSRGRGFLDELGLASMQPYYDELVDALEADESTPEGKARMIKVTENLIAYGVVGSVAKSLMAGIANWKLLLTGGATVTAADADAAGVGPFVKGALHFMGKSGDDAMMAAKEDTRQGADIVAERLKVLVTPDKRVAGGKYSPNQPNGQPWSAMTDAQLAVRGPGYKGTDADIARLWQEAVDESSEAAKIAVANTNARVTLNAADWDKALSLPKRAQLWYELSGDAFRRRIPILSKDNNLFVTFNDLVGVTSPREKPLDNLRRSLALLSQRVRGEPVDVDLTNPAGVREAFAREGSGSAVTSGNKTGNFSDTMSLVGGANVPPPIPVNDIWVGRIFGVKEDQLMQFQSLHEPMAIFWNKMRDSVNAMSPGALPHESWQLQARGWVSLRGAQDDYAQGLNTIVEQLRDAGIPGVTKNGVITEQALKHPDFVATIRPTVPPFRKAPKATIEFGTTQTPEGRQATAAASELRALPDDPKATRLLGEYHKILTTEMRSSARGSMNMWDQAYAHVMGITSKAKADVSRIAYPRSDRPFDIAGTFEGVFSPNIRVPLRGMDDNQVTLFNAIVGTGLRQDAMAASRIRILNAREKAAPNTVEGRSVFIQSASDIDGSVIEGFYKALPEGFEISTDRVANGYLIDINPRFTDAGAVGATRADVRKAVAGLKSAGYDTILLRHQYRSVYNEAKEYAPVIKKQKKELLDGAAKELKTKLGWSQARSRRFLNGRGMGEANASDRRAAQRIRAGYEGRLNSLDRAISSAGKTSDKVRERQKGWLIKYEKFKNKKTPVNTQNPPTEAGFSMDN